MNKVQIQVLLNQQKVNSITDIICFVIQQVNKTISQQPIDQINYRLNELEKSKGLDVIMIQQVKTICQAMIDQRQQNLKIQLDNTLNQHWQHMEQYVHNLNANQKSHKSINNQNRLSNYQNRNSLAELDILNFLNTNSFNNGQDDIKRNGFYDQFRKNRDSFKQQLSKQFTRDNLLFKDNLTSDCDRLKQTLQTQRKQINDLKYSLMQINRQISNKITIQEAHSIISQFESRIIHKIQNQKLQLQKLQFNVKKQLQQQILKIKKQAHIDFDPQSIKKDISNIKKVSEKLQKKLDKYKDQTKSISKIVKNLQVSQKIIIKQAQKQKKQFQDYSKFNNSKNQDLSMILQQINQKLTYFDKLDQLQTKLNSFKSDFAKASWTTQCKTKNQSIVWEKQISNSSNQMFKFQSQKSQILINQVGTYLVEFNLLQSKSSQISGSIWIQSTSLQSKKQQYKSLGSNTLKYVVQIQDKSLMWLKLLGGQTSQGIGGKGLLKISKF